MMVELKHLRSLTPQSLEHLTAQSESHIRERLWAQVLVGLAAGLCVGVLVGPSTGWLEPDVSRLVSRWVALPGRVFLGVIQMIVIPLVVSSIIRGLASTEDVRQLRRLGPRIAGYFVVTTTVAILIGLTVATVIRPGRFVDRSRATELTQDVETPEAQPEPLPSIEELPTELVDILPDNPLGSMVEGQML